LRISKKSSTFATAFWVHSAKSAAKVLQKIRIRKKIVKKHQSYWVLLFALLISSIANAKVNSYVGAYASAGEWSLLPSQSKYSASFGAAGGLGFLYEMQAGPTYSPTRFLFDVGVGVHGGWTSFNQSSSAKTVIENQKDLNGDVFDYVYEVKDRHDQYTNLAVQVPLMIGVQHRKFYMLAGAKVSANVLTKAHTNANITTYGDYKAFDPFYNMPEYQFFNDLPIKKKADASLNLNVDVSLEIGGRFGLVTDAVGYDVPKRKIEYRLAGFVDYGLLDIHKARDLDFFTAPGFYDAEAAYGTTTMVDGLEVNDIMSTSGFAKAVNNLVVGLKFTVLFQLPEQGKCVICRDAYRSSARGGGSRRGMKYEE
jgi:hypothetical protein